MPAASNPRIRGSSSRLFPNDFLIFVSTGFTATASTFTRRSRGPTVGISASNSTRQPLSVTGKYSHAPIAFMPGILAPARPLMAISV